MKDLAKNINDVSKTRPSRETLTFPSSSFSSSSSPSSSSGFRNERHSARRERLFRGGGGSSSGGSGSSGSLPFLPLPPRRGSGPLLRLLRPGRRSFRERLGAQHPPAALFSSQGQDVHVRQGPDVLARVVLFQGLGRSRQRRGERGERGEGADGGVEGEQGVAGADVGALLVVFGRESIRVSFLDFLFSVENKQK